MTKSVRAFVGKFAWSPEFMHTMLVAKWDWNTQSKCPTESNIGCDFMQACSCTAPRVAVGTHIRF